MDQAEAAMRARQVLRAADRATLATSSVDGAWPYASLVMLACDHDATPILLLSTLAEHTKNLLADGRVSLLVDATAGLDEPLTGARVTILGRCERTTEPRHRARYLARHPSAAMFADFKDFAFYKVTPTKAHLVAGFGKITWIDAAQLLFDARPTAALAEAEPGIVAHMNGDHPDAVELYAHRLLGLSGAGWRMTGIDPEGCDLRAGGRTARFAFERTIDGAEAARAELVRLVKSVREMPG
ncbi:MAG: HugZ family protein [Alphaproteobacteria bacterium]